ncbi:MFS transporter [Kribbella sp. NPDC002412]
MLVAAFAVLCAAQVMLIVDVVVLTVALPTIQAALGIPTDQLHLAGIAYTLTFGSLLIVAGRAGDLYGRRRVFRIGLLVFTIASALAALSQEGWHLFAARVLQGAGAAMVSPTALALVTSLFQGDQRNRALGIWASAGSVGAVLGQVLGGVLTDLFGWQSIFLINLPIGIAGLALAGRLPDDRTTDRPSLDVAGALLLAVGVAAFSIGLIGAPLSLLIAAVVLAAFWWHERRRPEPLVRFGLLRMQAVQAGNGVLAVLAGTTAAALFFATLYLQDVTGYSALQVGLAFAPITVVVLVVSPYAGRLAGRFGARPLMAVGTATTTAGLLLLAFVSPDGSYFTDVLPGLTLVALGNGLAFAPTMIAATAVDAADSGLASGLLNTAQELGSATGLATLAAIAAVAAQPAVGYRAGYLAAAALVLLATVLALRTPRSTGVVGLGSDSGAARGGSRGVCRDPAGGA